MSGETEKRSGRRRLATRLVLYILLYSSIITLLLTAAQLYRDYNIDVGNIRDRLRQIEYSSAPSISNDLWELNRGDIIVHINGLRSLPDIEYLSVTDERQQIIAETGERLDRNVIDRVYPLSHLHRGREIAIGELYVAASLEGVYQRLLDRVVVILVSQATKTFLVSLFIFILFQRLITRHLFRIADYVSGVEPRGSETPLVLERRESRRTRNDELAQVVNAINAMQDKLHTSFQALSDHQDILESTVKQRTRELEQTNRELTSFCYSVSHDLRSPLRSINGFSEALMEDYGDQLDAQALNYLERVSGSARHMGQLMDDLLGLSRVSQRELLVEPVDMSQLSQEVIDVLREREPQRQVTTQVQPGMHAQGDRGLLRLAMENLIGNAWKYTGRTEEARIEVSCVIDEGEKIFQVSDNGCGFDMRYAGKLFLPFERLHNASEFEGTGVGLATVQRIVERHGGRVWAEARPDDGAVFYFALPEKVEAYARRDYS